MYLPSTTVDDTFAQVHMVGRHAKAAFLWLTLADSEIYLHVRSQSLYGAKQFYEYAERMGERVMSGIDPATLKQFLAERGYALHDGAAGLPAHMTPDNKNKVFLFNHELVRTSEVFHNALCRVVK